MYTLKRSEDNPILSPLREHNWESAASFNGCPATYQNSDYIIYRALGEPDPLFGPYMRTSVIGIGTLKDSSYINRHVLISNDSDFDKYGCEDPRVTKIDDTYYIFYTALGGFPFTADNIKVAVGLSKDLKTVYEKRLVTPFNAKAMALFPEKINGKLAGMLTVNTDRKPADICYVEFDNPEDLYSEDFWNKWYSNLEAHKYPLKRMPHEHVELGAAPIRTKKGWLVLYSHIYNYEQPNTIFGVEAVLLDLNNPRKIIGRTKGSMMIPEAYYEKIGMVRNIVFPTGSAISGKNLEIYYGVSDTHTAMATVNLENLLRDMIEEDLCFKRYSGNPIISPRPGILWEAGGTLNPASIDLNGKIYLIYRAVSDKNVSTFGLSVTEDGYTIDERPDTPIYTGHAIFETRGNEDTNFGVEDPRIIEIEGRLYITYTGYNGSVPRVAVISIKTEDFINRKFDKWSEPEAISPDYIDDKDSCIIPEKIGGKYMVFHRIGTNICADFVDSLDFKHPLTKCIEILEPRIGMWDGGKVGISTQPIKTEKGWLLFYHGSSERKTYRMGAVLLGLVDPTDVLARTTSPLLAPKEPYEQSGVVPHVVFPCGAIVRGDRVLLYYGAGDSVIAVATGSLSEILDILE